MVTGRSPCLRGRHRTGPGRTAGCILLVAAFTGCVMSDPQTVGPGPDPMDAVSTAGSYLIGRTAYRHGDINAASVNYDRALKADPGNLSLTHRLFMVRLEQGRIEDAIGLARLISATPAGAAPLPLVVVALGLDHAANGDWEQAIAQFETLAGSQVSLILKHLLTGWALAGSGDWAGADARLSDLARNTGIEGLSLLHRAYARVLAGNPEEGRRLLARAMDLDPWPSLRLRLAMAVLLATVHRDDAARAALALAGNDGVHAETLHALLGRARKGEPVDGQVSTAIHGMAEALFDVASVLQRIERSRSAERQQGTASAAQRHERSRSADRLQGQVLALARLSRFLNPQFVPASLLVARTLAARDNHEAAVEVYTAVPVTSPYHDMSRLRAARALFNADRADEAITLLEQLGAERPEDPAPWAQIGDLHRRQRQWDRAAAAYTEALDRVAVPSAPDWRLFYYRGVVLERSDRWPEAEASFLRALDLSPEQAYVLNYLGYHWTELGVRLDEAERMIRRANELEPENGYIIDSLGWILLRTGRVEQAVPLLEHAVRLLPADVTINEHLGDAYWRAGRREEAVYQWKRADALDPEPDQREEIRAKIRNGLPDET
ncbi:MAG: tetratricopeptide repeat protein [Alphaproteobacteria bacterium]|nr:tetratricopeptide repeat protein [Alphaproteobacteria bacterium]